MWRGPHLRLPCFLEKIASHQVTYSTPKQNQTIPTSNNARNSSSLLQNIFLIFSLGEFSNTTLHSVSVILGRIHTTLYPSQIVRSSHVVTWLCYATFFILANFWPMADPWRKTSVNTLMFFPKKAVNKHIVAGFPCGYIKSIQALWLYPNSTNTPNITFDQNLYPIRPPRSK